MQFRFVFAFALAALLPAIPAQADPLPDGFELHKFNASQTPTTTDGITTFHVIPNDCSDVDYGDGRGESDCVNGNVKSIIRYERDAKLGESVEYKFDVQIDPSFKYPGEYNLDALPFRPGGWDSSLRIASWEGPYIKNFVYMLKADATKGITFFGQQCQSPDRFGEWMSFSLKVRWANDSKGWVVATCDGKPVYVEEGASSTKQIQCYLGNECQPGVVRDPKSFNYILGLAFNGYGFDWKENGHPSAFRDMQPDGLTMRMRNISVTQGIELYGPEEKALVVKLQEALNSLGCDVGKADGVPGKRTREAALTCRKFADGAMPSALNVTTVAIFVELYTSEGVADLPPGELPPEPLVIHFAQTGSETSGQDPQVVADFDGTVSGGPVEELSVLAIGDFNPGRKAFEYFALLLKDNLGKKTDVASCEGVRIEDWGQGGVHAVIEFQIVGSTFTALDFGCVTSKLPEETALEADFIVTQFKEIAASMITDGTIAGVSHDGLRNLIERAASGEVKILKR